MIDINENSATPIYQQIYDNFLKLIVLKVLPEGEKLPSVRELALTININPNTIQKAYKALEQDQYLVSQKGKGNFVNTYEIVMDVYRTTIEQNLIDEFTSLRRIGQSKEEIVAYVEKILEDLK